MPLLPPSMLPVARALSELVYCNPFLPERMEHERRALGDAFVPAPPIWNLAADTPVHGGEPLGERENLALLREQAQRIADDARAALVGGVRPTAEERRLYEDAALYVLYERVRDLLHQVAQRTVAGEPTLARNITTAWDRFRTGFEHYFIGDAFGTPSHRPEHVFACFFQIRRAFSHIYHYLIGGSMPAAELRAAVWQSIFTHDLRRYYRGLYDRMADFTTLITGASGTGKELVARAIGRSRYIPFDPVRKHFTEDFETTFYAVNLSALSPTLIESELFGHKKGSFTGAIADRKGYLEECPPLGTVFLDEIGELHAEIQVKLLRVLQDRTFARLGETRARSFQGKIIGATNRDLAVEMAAGRFRRDFYYRLCSDMVQTPTLREQLAGRPAELAQLVRYVAHRLLPQPEDAETLAGEVMTWIDRELGRDYAWPGNFRELEQCVRNITLRGRYQPAAAVDAGSALDRLLGEVRDGALSAEELLNRYTTLVVSRSGSYVAAARRLGLDRRTVRARVDADLLASFQASSSRA